MKKYFIILIILALSGCSTTTKIANESVPTEKPIEDELIEEISKISLLDVVINEDPFDYAKRELSNQSSLKEIDKFVYSVASEGLKENQLSAVIDFNNFELISFERNNMNYLDNFILNWSEISFEIGECKYFLGSSTKNDCNEYTFDDKLMIIDGNIEMILRIFYPGYYHAKESFSLIEKLELMSKLSEYVVDNYAVDRMYDNSEFRDKVKNTIDFLNSR